MSNTTSTCLLPVLITNSNTLLATIRDIPPKGAIFNFCKTTTPGILKILVAFSGYFSVTVMCHSSCRESLALRSCFSRESTRMGKRPRKWTKLSDKCHQSKYITIHRRKYNILVANITPSLQMQDFSLPSMDLSNLKWD